MTIAKIMKKVIVADENISGRMAAKIMSEKEIGSLVIFKDGKILGIITERDVLRNLSKLDSPVKAIMTKKVITVDSKEEIDIAAELMATNKIKRLPVLEKGKLVGIITATDIIANAEEINEDFFFE